VVIKVCTETTGQWLSDVLYSQANSVTSLNEYVNEIQVKYKMQQFIEWHSFAEQYLYARSMTTPSTRHIMYQLSETVDSAAFITENTINNNDIPNPGDKLSRATLGRHILLQ